MSFFKRLGRVFNAGTERIKFGGIQGVLKLHLKKSPIDSPRIQELISQATASAWSISFVSEFFQRLGFSYEDYDVMYRAAVIACPDRLIGHNLIATSMMIDRCRDLSPAFRRIAEAVSLTQSNNRTAVLSALTADLAKTATR